MTRVIATDPLRQVLNAIVEISFCDIIRHE
jgi:hypothetical protein